MPGLAAPGDGLLVGIGAGRLGRLCGDECAALGAEHGVVVYLGVAVRAAALGGRGLCGKGGAALRAEDGVVVLNRGAADGAAAGGRRFGGLRLGCGL